MNKQGSKLNRDKLIVKSDINQSQNQKINLDTVEHRIIEMVNKNQYEWLFIHFEKANNWKMFYPQFNLINLTYRYVVR